MSPDGRAFPPCVRLLEVEYSREGIALDQMYRGDAVSLAIDNLLRNQDNDYVYLSVGGGSDNKRSIRASIHPKTDAQRAEILENQQALRLSLAQQISRTWENLTEAEKEEYKIIYPPSIPRGFSYEIKLLPGVTIPEPGGTVAMMIGGNRYPPGINPGVERDFVPAAPQNGTA